MELVKTTTGLRFSEAFSPWQEMRNIIRSVGDNASVEIEGPPLILDLKNKKQRVVVHIKGLDFTQEGMASLDEGIDIAADRLVKSNSASKLPQISQIWHESVFIEPYALPFHELLLRMKNRFFRPSALVDPTTDIGLIFDQAEGDVFKHFQFGPMVREQLLRMYLNYGRDGLPNNFVFLSLRYQRNKSLAFEAESVREFLRGAVQWQRQQAQTVISYLEEKGATNDVRRHSDT